MAGKQTAEGKRKPAEKSDHISQNIHSQGLELG
jgi:hypothetical protein